MRAKREAASVPLIEQLTPFAVGEWIPEALLGPAREDIERGRVTRPAITERRIQAVVADADHGRVRVRIAWGAGRPTSSCECGAAGDDACRHAAALALLLLGDAQPSGAFEADEDEDARRGPSALADEERKRRRERGASELFEVRRRPRRSVYGAYEVVSPSSRSYEVTLRNVEALHNSCTCPDLATNLLGTCKHIEAVLHVLHKDASKRLARAALAGPDWSYLYLRFDPESSEPEVRIQLAESATPEVARLAKRYFGANGLSAAPLDDRFGDLVRRATSGSVEVPPEVLRYAERVQSAAAGRARALSTEREVRAAGAEPPEFYAKLYPYQVEGVAFLVARRRALLADDMGLGKTAQAIAAMVWLMRTSDVRRTLIVCPTSLKHQWKREIERFAKLDEGRVVVIGGRREVRREQYASMADVMITSYELARTDERDLADHSVDLLILDEAQRIKNWRTRTADAVKRLSSRFAFVLTGTPLENRLDDLYSLMQVIDPHLFGPLWRFNEHFTRLDERGKVLGYQRLDDLRRRVAPVMLRRRKEDVLSQLPDQIVNRLTVPMTEEQTAIHADAELSVARLVAILKRRPLRPVEEQRLFRAFQRMRMACDAAGLVDKETEGSPKLDELAGLLDEICVQGRRKVVVFSEWERMQRMAADICDKLAIGYVRLHGGVPSESRGGLLERFWEDPSCLVFLSTDAGGVGLNLQVASHVINLDLPWNPAVLAQRLARVHRLGQKDSVNVVLLVSQASFEEKMESTLEAKRALFAAAVGDDAETTEIDRSTLASRIATLLGATFAADTGRVAPKEEENAAATSDPVADLRARVGDALERVVRLADGRLLGVVRGDGAPVDDGATLLVSGAAARAMAQLGGLSPVANAEVLYEAPANAPEDPSLAARRERLAAADRKLKAARALVSAGLGAEALGLFRETMTLACRALDERGDPGDDPALLLAAVYGHLLPEGALNAGDAGALVRAGELARAFSMSPIPPPETLVQKVSAEAVALLDRARARVLGSPRESAPTAQPTGS